MGWPGKTLTPVHNSMQFVYTPGFALPAGNPLPTNSTACHYAFAPPPPTTERSGYLVSAYVRPYPSLPGIHCALHCCVNCCPSPPLLSTLHPALACWSAAAPSPV